MTPSSFFKENRSEIETYTYSPVVIAKPFKRGDEIKAQTWFSISQTVEAKKNGWQLHLLTDRLCEDTAVSVKDFRKNFTPLTVEESDALIPSRWKILREGESLFRAVKLEKGLMSRSCITLQQAMSFKDKDGVMKANRGDILVRCPDAEKGKPASYKVVSPEDFACDYIAEPRPASAAKPSWMKAVQVA